MNYLRGKGVCLLAILLAYYYVKIGAIKQPKLTTRPKVFTTVPTEPFEPDEQEIFMSQPREEHKSKFVESVIFEPQPRILLSRSTYKVTSFIDFMPYKEAFKKFETFHEKV